MKTKLTNRIEEDKQLLASMQQGNQAAFDKLFRRYYATLCAYARRFVSLEDAEEIVQELFVWIWESRETLFIETSVSQYLFKATYRRSLNHITRNQVKQRADTFFYEEMIETLHDIDYYHIGELTKHIETAIRKLPDSYREAFVMHRFRDMSYKEIAAVLEVSPKTVDYRIQQALKRLKTDLKEFLPLILPFLIK